jgi:integrase
MSLYSVKGKGWRYDFTQKGDRHTEAWFKTKAAARKAEAEKRKELERPIETGMDIPIDMVFLELVNRRLDHVKAYNSRRYYTDYLYMAKRWIRRWGKLPIRLVTSEKLERFILQRTKISNSTANKEIRFLRATFNFGKKRKMLESDPTEGMEFFPTVKMVRFVPSSAEIDRVIAKANPNIQDYLWTIRETMARVSEVNQLTWNDVFLAERYVVLYTRKKKGGHLTPRKIPMTGTLFEVLSRRYKERDSSKPWVFWHTCWSSKTGKKFDGPYQDRKKIMRTLCRKAGVPYFRFHAIRHSGASVMENGNVPIGAIQRILGHENRSTTEIYLHGLSGSERDAMDVFEQARGKSLTQSLTQTKKESANSSLTP